MVTVCTESLAYHIRGRFLVLMLSLIIFRKLQVAAKRCSTTARLNGALHSTYLHKDWLDVLQEIKIATSEVWRLGHVAPYAYESV